MDLLHENVMSRLSWNKGESESESDTLVTMAGVDLVPF